MHERNSRKLSTAVTLSLLGSCLFSVLALAQNVKVKGIIKARSGDTLTLQTDASNVTVLLTDTTDVGQLQGALKARNKKMSMAALIPGLPIEVEGANNAQEQLVATKIRFKGNDFQQAQAIQAGMHEQEKLNEQQQAELAAQNAALKQQQTQLDEQHQKIAANKAAIAANTARFGQLDDYYIYDEVTIYFANGKSTIEPKYNAPLMALGQEGRVRERLHDRSQRLCLHNRERCPEPEAQPGSRVERGQSPAAAGTDTAGENACSGSHGRDQRGRQVSRR